jgi:hypothetical protein
MIELCVRHPPVFIKLKSGLTNNKFWEMQFFRVSGEWECPEGTLLPENRRMPRTCQLLRPDRSDPPSLSVSDQEDVKKISGWSAIRVKIDKFEEVDFDNLVTEENLRQFLGYDIPRDKQLITKRGAIKKRNDAPPSPKPVTKNRPFKSAEEVPEDVPLRKKQNIPLAASGARRTPPSVPSSGVIIEEGSASFRGIVPEVSPTPEASAALSFVLRDESGFEASYQGEHGAETSFEEPPLGTSTVTAPEPERSGEGNETVPEARDIQVTRRVKHPARKRKFTTQDRIAEKISEAERMWGKAVIRPFDAEEVHQEPAPSGDESLEERDEDAGTPRDEPFIEEFEAEGTPQTPSSERPETPPPPKDNCEMGHATPQAPCSTPVQPETHTGTPEVENIEGPRTSREAIGQDMSGAALEVQGANQPETTTHLGVLEGFRVDSENVIPEAGVLPESSTRSRSRVEASSSRLRSDESDAAPNTGVVPPVGPSFSSRVSAGFEVLGRGLLGHPMEAIKNLIPEGYLGNAGASSPEKIAQGILISHYQVSF